MTRSGQYVGAGVILVSGNRYLLLKGRDTGIWSFSKGHPETNDQETPLRTAVRETLEETGLRVSIDYRIIGNSLRFGKRPYWVGLTVKSEPHIKMSRSEHSEAGWFTVEEIEQMKADTNADVRGWLKKMHGEFTRLTSYKIPEKTETRSIALDCSASLA
jgi:8-oxo-dGTP pyrophosphatase MutT (NUDIX family)